MTRMASTPPLPAGPARGASISRDRWARRRDAVIAVLGWICIAWLSLWAAWHVIRALLIVILAALLAYALLPAVAFLARFVPRWLAVVLVYLSVVCVLGGLGY